MKRVIDGERVVANINSAAFEPLMDSKGVDIGQSVLQLNKSQPNGVGFHAYKMAPGMTTEAHVHTGDEEFFLLEGDLVDNDGTQYVPGDLVLMKSGTEHHSTTKKGCTLLVYIPSEEAPLKDVGHD